MSDSEQGHAGPKPFRLGPLGTLNQIVVALGKTIRAMADDTIDSQKGARICSGLGILRQTLETTTLERIKARLDELSGESPRHSSAHTDSVRLQ